MKKEPTILQQALVEAKELKDAAVANATLSMQEFITPKLKEILESALGEAMDDEDDEDKAPEETEAKDESVLEKLQGLGLDETTLAKLTTALEGSHKEDEEAPAEEEKEEEVDETLDIDAALAEVEATLEGKKEEDEEMPAEDDEEAKNEGGLSEEEINKILAEMEDDEEEAPEDDEKLDEKVSDDEDEDPKEATILELQNQLAEAMKVVKSQGETIAEINLLNSKVTYLSKILVKENLTPDHKARVITAFEKVKTPGEAKVLFEAFDTKLQTKQKTITESLGIGNNTNKKVITESKETQWSPEALEMQRRAGIIK